MSTERTSPPLVGYDVTVHLKAKVGDVVRLKAPIRGKRDRAVVMGIRVEWGIRSELHNPLFVYEVGLERQGSNKTIITKTLPSHAFDREKGNIRDSHWEVLPPWEGFLL